MSQVKRHTFSAIWMHWFNAACWLFLSATGFGLVDNASMQPFCMGWPVLMKQIFGSSGNLLVAHVICGSIWIAGMAVSAILFLKNDTRPFLKEIFSFSFQKDARWLILTAAGLTLGERRLARMGIDPNAPHQGFYNAGQKLFALCALFCGFILTGTGIILLLSKGVIDTAEVVQWAMLIHFVAAGVLFAGLLIHIYMAVIAPDQRPALISMLTGSVSQAYARRHHRLWHDRVVKNKK